MAAGKKCERRKGREKKERFIFSHERFNMSIIARKFDVLQAKLVKLYRRSESYVAWNGETAGQAGDDSPLRFLTRIRFSVLILFPHSIAR